MEFEKACYDGDLQVVQTMIILILVRLILLQDYPLLLPPSPILRPVKRQP